MCVSKAWVPLIICSLELFILCRPKFWVSFATYTFWGCYSGPSCLTCTFDSRGIAEWWFSWSLAHISLNNWWFISCGHQFITDIDTRLWPFFLSWNFSKDVESWFHSQFELLKIYLCITIHIETAQNCNKFLFCWDMTSVAQKPLQIALVDIAIAPIINCSKCF